jgi:hypothetical protein
MRGSDSVFLFGLFPVNFNELPCKNEIGKLLNNLKISYPISINNPENLPFQLKNKLPNKPPREFIEWLVGFVDGEGHFYIDIQNQSVSFKFKIELHIDDVEILHKISKMLGIGKVYTYTYTGVKNRNLAMFMVWNIKEIVEVLLPIFQEFPLQTSKYFDFIAFSEAVLIKLECSQQDKSKKLSETGFNKIKTLKAMMNSKRLFLEKNQEDYLRNKVNITKWWLLGFVEGEGTFGYKHLVPYFQIAQHKKNLMVLNAIELYLANILKEYTKNIGIQELGVHCALNKRTDVYSVTIGKIDILSYFLIPFFESMTFLTRKSVDYHYWVISVLLHKFGYYYLPEGKKIALQISTGTNKYRYSTNDLKKDKVTLPSADSISKLLAPTPPFDISSDRGHLELVKEFTVSKGGHKGFTVYVYECGSKGYKELKGSPFSSYGAGHVAIGQRPGSRTIGRYIDTGKVYKDKYLFSSVPI